MINKHVIRTDENIASVFNDQTKITQVIQAGIQAALLKHKYAGKSICEWKDDQVHWISAEKISIQQNKG